MLPSSFKRLVGRRRLHSQAPAARSHSLRQAVEQHQRRQTRHLTCWRQLAVPCLWWHPTLRYTYHVPHMASLPMPTIPSANKTQGHHNRAATLGRKGFRWHAARSEQNQSRRPFGAASLIPDSPVRLVQECLVSANSDTNNFDYLNWELLQAGVCLQ